MDRKSPIRNCRLPERSFDEVNHILATPRYKRGDLVRNTIPEIDQNVIDNWLRRGWLDLANVCAIGGAKELRKIAAVMDENEALGAHRRYTGSDILKVIVLQAISQAGLPFKLAPEIIRNVLERAAKKLYDPDDKSVALVVAPDGNGDYTLHLGERDAMRSLETEWFTIIDIDRILDRFFSTPAGRKTEPDSHRRRVNRKA